MFRFDDLLKLVFVFSPFKKQIRNQHYADQEPVPTLKKRIQNILNSDDKIYGAQLRKLIREQGPPAGSDAKRLEASDGFIQDILYFSLILASKLNFSRPFLVRSGVM